MFVLDSSVFIEASRRYYAFDIAPTFWDSLINSANNKQLCSIDWVKKELLRGNDELADWARNDFSSAFFSSDRDDIGNNYSLIMNWVNGQGQFTGAAKADFAKGADGWVVSFAMVNSYVVVTQEVYSPEIKRKVPIPNVCREFGVEYIDTFNMLRKLNIRF